MNLNGIAIDPLKCSVIRSAFGFALLFRLTPKNPAIPIGAYATKKMADEVLAGLRRAGGDPGRQNVALKDIEANAREAIAKRARKVARSELPVAEALPSPTGVKS